MPAYSNELIGKAIETYTKYRAVMQSEAQIIAFCAGWCKDHAPKKPAVPDVPIGTQEEERNVWTCEKCGAEYDGWNVPVLCVDCGFKMLPSPVIPEPAEFIEEPGDMPPDGYLPAGKAVTGATVTDYRVRCARFTEPVSECPQDWALFNRLRLNYMRNNP